MFKEILDNENDTKPEAKEDSDSDYDGQVSCLFTMFFFFLNLFIR